MDHGRGGQRLSIMVMLSVQQACLGYKQPVVGPLSFQLRAGERLGIWGPNGCGKSTLLKYFTGEARLFSGTIDVEPTLPIAYQPQYPQVAGELPLMGKEYLALMAADHEPVPKGLKSFLQRRVDQLSGGQFQILSTWANLSARAPLVLLDEPTNNLDPGAIALLVDTIRAVPARHGVIVVSHERSFLDQVSTRVLDIGKPSPNEASR